MYKNMDVQLKNISCKDREFYVGACFALQTVLNLEDEYKSNLKYARGM